MSLKLLMALLCLPALGFGSTLPSKVDTTEFTPYDFFEKTTGDNHGIIHVCEGAPLNLKAPSFIKHGTYTWVGPNDQSSNERNFLIEKVGLENQGNYQLEVDVNGTKQWAQVAVVVHQFPKYKILHASQNGFYRLVGFNESSFKISWCNELGDMISEAKLLSAELAAEAFSVTLKWKTCEVKHKL